MGDSFSKFSDDGTKFDYIVSVDITGETSPCSVLLVLMKEKIGSELEALCIFSPYNLN